MSRQNPSPLSFPLRLSQTLREDAARFADEEGVSLNFLITQAVSEKIARMQLMKQDRAKQEEPSEEDAR